MNIVLREFDTLTHVGLLDNNRKEDSFEGKGLSVSNDPSAWKRIGKGTVLGDEWRVSRIDHKPLSLIDYHALSSSLPFKEAVVKYGVRNNLLTVTPLYRVTLFDCETDSEFFSDHVSYDEAFCEADENDDVIQLIQGYLATKHLCQQSRVRKIDPVLVFDYVAILYLESLNCADGIWWNDVLDVYSYSAPRGVLFHSCLQSMVAINNNEIEHFFK